MNPRGGPLPGYGQPGGIDWEAALILVAICAMAAMAALSAHLCRPLSRVERLRVSAAQRITPRRR